MQLRHLFVLIALVAFVLPAAATVTVLPLGDSITRGDMAADSTSGSYRYYLFSSLTAAGYDVDFIGSTTLPDFTKFSFDQDHDGHGGYETGTYLETDPSRSLATLLRASPPPDYVLLHIGTNDAVHQVPLETRLSNLRRMIGILQERSPEVTVLLARIIPTSNRYRNDNQIVPFNDALAALAAECSRPGSRVVLVDQYGGFDGVNDTQADGIHPNVNGMRKIASTWYAALAPLIPPPAPTTAVTTFPTIPLPTTPSVVAVPGGTGAPRDLNGDERYEDVNGNGRKDFADVVLYFNQMSWIATNEPLFAFDYNGNNRIDFADAVRLFEAL